MLTQLGLVNEVQRPDRDEHIEVNWFAISDDFKQLFQKHSEWSPVNEGYPFDLHSVMMFDSYDFTKDCFNSFQHFCYSPIYIKRDPFAFSHTIEVSCFLNMNRIAHTF